MKCDLRLPTNFKEHSGDAIITNIDYSINSEIQKVIKNQPLFSRYTARNFNGIVWWNENIGFWCAEVWVFRKYVASYLAETLEALADEINNEHGKDENLLST